LSDAEFFDSNSGSLSRNIDKKSRTCAGKEECVYTNTETHIGNEDSSAASFIEDEVGMLQAHVQIQRSRQKYRGSNHKTIHLLSVGRSGSTFLGALLSIQGLPYVFEPDNGNGWGMWTDTTIPIEQRLDCLYTCEHCDFANPTNPTSSVIGEVCAASPEVVTAAIKTVDGLIDLSVLLNIPETQRLNTKFVLMVRDPRAMFYSAISENWTSLSNFDLTSFCRRPLLQYLSAKELAERIPRDQLRTLFFEQWSQEVETSVPELFEWAGLNISDYTRAHAISSAKASALAWTKKHVPT